MPSLILLDLMMPEMDGFEFVSEMRRAGHNVPIVVVTAKSVSRAERKRLGGSVAGLIEKRGLDRETLLKHLREHIGTAP